MLHSRLHPLYPQLVQPRGYDLAYRFWVEQEQATQPQRAWYEAGAADLACEPLISIVASAANIRLTRSESRLGIAGATNRASELASGEYVAFLDQDDLLSPYALHHVAEPVQDTPVDLVYSDR